MESAIKTVVSTYLKSAKGKENLSGKDFQSMVKNQLGNILNNAESSKAVKDMQQGLDDNQDGKVSFQEYMKLIGYLANAVSAQYVAEKGDKTANNDGAVTQSEAPAEPKAEAATEEPAAEAAAEATPAAAPVADGETEAEKPQAEEEEAPAAEEAAEEEKTEEEAS